MKNKTDEQKINENNIVEKYHTLQTDYYHIEDEKSALENRLKKVKKRYRLIMIVLVTTGLIVGGYFQFGKLTALVPVSWKSENAQKKVVTDNIIIVQQKTLQNTLLLTGKIEPLNQVEILSPLAGTVKEKDFQYGAFTEKDKLLLVIDTEVEQVKYREAQAACLEAEAEFDALKNWKKGPEVTGKRHELTKSQYALEATQRQLKENRRLLEKGIVAAGDVEKLEESYRNQQLDHKRTQEQLADILKQGGKDNVRMAELKLKNARFKRQELEERIHKAEVISPVDGVVLPPTSGQEEVSSEIQRGSFVKQDQSLFTIANLQGFIIKTQVEEIDILKLKIGQKVKITGDAFVKNFTLTGTVHYISSQANKDSRQQNMLSRFTVSILVSDLVEEQKRQLLLGMSTNLEVLLWEKTNALVLPFDVVTVDEKEQAWVTKLTKDTGKPEKIQVKVGISKANTVEIVEGLEVGDKILREPQPVRK